MNNASSLFSCRELYLEATNGWCGEGEGDEDEDAVGGSCPAPAAAAAAAAAATMCILADGQAWSLTQIHYSSNCKASNKGDGGSSP